MSEPHLIYASFELLARWFPPPPLDPEVISSAAVLAQENKRWSVIGGIQYALVFSVTAALFIYLVLDAAHDRLAHLGQPLFLIRAGRVELVFWTLFLALILSCWLMFFCLRLTLGKESYREYVMVVSHANPMGGPHGVKVHFGKVFRFFAIALALPLAYFIALRVDSYTAFTEQALIHSPMSSLGREEIHRYTEVKAIYAIAAWHARFEDKVKPRHAIFFTDGTLWTSDAGLRAPRPDEDQRFIGQVAQRSGKPVTPVKFFEDIPR